MSTARRANLAFILALSVMIGCADPLLRSTERLEPPKQSESKPEVSLPVPPPPPRVVGKRSADMALQAAPFAVSGVAAGNVGALAPSTVAMESFPGQFDEREFNTEEYGRISENPFLRAVENPLSTFSIDVDRASYANVRRFLLDQRQLPPADAVRIEELVNYFNFDYSAPKGSDPFAVHTELADCPWKSAHRLLRIGLQARRIATEDLPPSNLVFLIDVSGSMMSADKLPLVQAALPLLVDQLRPDDRVSIVVYAGAAGLVLPPTSGANKGEIISAITNLQAGGSTAGGEGILLAYETAKKSFIRGGNNRVILATDGDFNVGISSDGELERLIEEKRRDGIFLTVLGFGTGNIKDSKMEILADKGNGNYAYIDTLMEAKKTLVSEIGGTLFTIAKDVKLQIEFNPARVAGYRLLGYENRLLRAQDFNDDRKDAGEIGAGHSVTALYEIVPAGVTVPNVAVDELKYQTGTIAPTAKQSSELLTVKIRYKEPEGSDSRLMTTTVVDAPRQLQQASDDFRFAAAVAEFGMLLRKSEHRGDASFEQAAQLARASMGNDREGYRAELLQLIGAAQRFSSVEITSR